MSMTEEQQIALIKDLWKRYGRYVLTVITVLLISYTAWTVWSQHQIKMRVQASKTYDQLMVAFEQNDAMARSTHAAYLVQQYPKSPYAQVASLMLANIAVSDKKYDQALQHLQWVMTHAQLATFKQVARNRMARILLAQHKYQHALSVLQVVDDESYRPVIAAITGDIYAAQRDFSKARQYYQQALKQLPARVSLPLVQMKLDDLAAERVLENKASHA